MDKSNPDPLFGQSTPGHIDLPVTRAGGAMVSAAVVPGYHFLAVAIFAIGVVVIAQTFLLRSKASGDDHPIFALPDGPLLRLGVIGL